MAGTDPNFKASEFRAAIKQTMRMGMPEDESQRLTWHWKRLEVFDPEDQETNPYDWTQIPVVDEPGNPELDDEGDEQTLQVDYALEFAAKGAGSQTIVGEFDSSRAVVTVLDDDYELVRTADYVTIDDTKYEIDFDAPPLGMFDVTVYQVFLEAVDES